MLNNLFPITYCTKNYKITFKKSIRHKTGGLKIISILGVSTYCEGINFFVRRGLETVSIKRGCEMSVSEKRFRCLPMRALWILFFLLMHAQRDCLYN